MCHERFLCNSPFLRSLELNIADLHGGVILAVTPRNLVLIALFELQNGKFLGAPLRNDLAGNAGLRGIRAEDDLLVVGMHRQHGPKRDLFTYFSADSLDANRVARRDAVLFSPG